MIRENICIDYLTATFSYIDRQAMLQSFEKDREMTVKFFTLENEIVTEVVHKLGFDIISATKADYAVNGYKVMYTFGEHIQLLLGGAKNRDGFPTCQLLMSGSACREFEKQGGNWYELRKHLMDLKGINFTRTDIAFDLFHEDYFTLNELWTKIVDREEFSARSETIEPRVRWRRNTSPREYLERGIYIGSLQSETTINVYDKNLERRQVAGQDTWLNTWIRIELRFKGKKANTVNTKLDFHSDRGFVDTALGILKTTLDIKTNKGAARMRDRKTWYKWENFLKGIQKVNLKNQYELEHTISVKRKWIDRAAGKSLALIKLVNEIVNTPEQFEKELNGYMVSKDEKFTNSDLRALNEYLKDNYGLSPVTFEEVFEIMNNWEANRDIDTPF